MPSHGILFQHINNPYVGKLLAISSGFLIDVMLELFITVTLMVVVSIVVSVKFKLEVNMKTIFSTIGVVGGAAFLGRMAQFLNTTRDALG